MSMNLVNDNGPELQKSFERIIPFSNVSIQMKGFLENEKDILETSSFGKSLFFKKHPQKDIVEGWFILSKYKEAIDEIKKKIIEDPDYTGRVINRIEDVWRELENLAKQSVNYVESVKKSKEELIRITEYYYGIGHKSIPAAWSFDIIGWALTELIEEELKKIKKFSPDKVVILMSYGISSIFSDEKLEFFDLLKGSFNEDFMKKHFEKWSFIGMDTPVGKPHDLDFFKTRAEELKGKNMGEEIRKIKENQAKELEEFNKHISEIEDLQFLRIIQNARKFIEFKNYERILLHKYIMDSLNIPITISQIIGLNYEDSQFITSQEISDLVKGNVQKKEILGKAKERKEKGFIFKIEDNKLVIDPYKEELIKRGEENFLRGLIASRGFVRGCVKIIEHPIRDSYKLKKGDILVTSMTTPDFVPLMERAGAVVTNEGGVLCHAAIISRELGVPAIVGTEKATEILKDGMFVEVRAHEEEGIIRIIESLSNSC